MMKRKKKIGCCLNAGCFSGGGRRLRDDWSSELEYDKDYEKYRREYEKEYARLCELQRALTPNERSKRSGSSTPFDHSTFSRQFATFDEHDISDEHVEHEIKKITEGAGDEDSDSDAELLERWMKEDEEAEMLDKSRKQPKMKRVTSEDLALKKRRDEEEFERKRREELAWKEREEVEMARKTRGEMAARKKEEIARISREELAKRQREEEEIVRINKEELARRQREEEEIARINTEELARRRREEEEIARINGDELAKRRREEEEIVSRKRQEEESARKQKEEEARRKWAEQELERQKKQKEEDDARIRREEVERQKREQEETERRKRLEEDDMRRRREEMARRKRQDEENARRKKMEEENLRRHKEEILNRSREREEIERRRRLEEENLWRQKEERRKREEEENERRRRIEEEERRKKMEEENARRQREEEEEEARRKWEEEEIAKKKREELALKEKEEQEIRRREEQARIAREQEEIERRKKEERSPPRSSVRTSSSLSFGSYEREREGEGRRKLEGRPSVLEVEPEELAGSKSQDEEDTTPRKKNEEQMEVWQTQQDLSWMSLDEQAKNRARGVSVKDERIDRIQRADSHGHEASPNANGTTTREIGDVKMLKEGGYHNGWREVEFLEEDEQDKSMKLIRNRTRRGKHVAGEDYDDGASASSSASEVPSEEWDKGKPANRLFSPLELVPEVKRKNDDQNEELHDTFEKRLLEAAKIPKEKIHNRLNSPAGILYGLMGVVLLISLFIFYLSFVARMKPPSECLNERIILNFSTTRIRLRGGRYLAFREQGVGADRAEHSVVVVHDLLSSRLAGIPGINESLLEEYKVRLISYDRPGYGQSDPHPGRNYNTSAYDIVEIADALKLGEKFWVVGFGGGGPHVWAAINYLPERLAGVAMFAPAGNPYVRGMSREEIEETWGVLTPRQKWLHTIARRFPVLLPRLLQKAAITDSPDVPTNVRLSLGQKDQTWMEQPHVRKAWQGDVKEALRHRCAFALAEELSMLVNDWGFRLSDLPFNERPATIFREMVASIFGKEKKPKIFEGPIHIWQGTDDQMVPVTMNSVAKRLVEQNKLLDLEEKSSPVKIHYMPGEGHFSWFWYCDECHRRIFQTLFRPNETLEAEEEPLPSSPKGFSKEDYEAIVKAFEALKMTPDTYTGGKTVKNSATAKEREQELQKVLRNVLRNRKIEEEYLRQQSDAAGKKGRFSTSKKPSEEMTEVHPMTCRATNDALGDQSVVYVCPEDDDDLPQQSDSAHQGLENVRKSKAARKGDNSRETKNKTGNGRSTYLEGLSTLVKRLARHRK